MKPVAYEIEGADKTLSDVTAEERASKFAIFVCQEYQYRSQVKGLIERHPGVVFASYMNATHTKKAPPYYPEDWYVYDKSGTPVRSLAFLDNFLTNPRSDWLEFVVSQVGPLTNAGYNAIYLDELGLGPIRTEGTTSQACLPGTDQPWTEPLWTPETVKIAQAVQGDTDKLVYANGLGNSIRYFYPNTSTTKPLLGPCDKVLGESFLRGAKMKGEPAKLFKVTDTNWKREIAMVKDAGPKGMFCTKIWSYPQDIGLVARVERWATGSFLLGAWSESGWFFSGPSKATIAPIYRGMYDRVKRLGNATGDATYTGSTGRRNFQHGYVFVDNAATDGRIVVTNA